jgi:hypothetical protein
LTQEKSLLQADWSIARLRPKGVSTGTMATQFDCTPQSPQPSQISVLMKTRLSGSGNCAALAPAAFFGRAGLDIDDGRHALDLLPGRAGRGAARRAVGSHPWGRRQVERLLRVIDHGDPRTPMAAIRAAIWSGDSPPSFFCPPVIATASL